MKPFFSILILLVGLCCTQKEVATQPEPDVFMVLLGIAQDAGYPQAGCNKSCCRAVWNGEVGPEKVTSLGLIDKANNKVYLFDATPDFREQLHELLSYLPDGDITSLGGIFLTHAHIGHYTGLMHLGREVMGTSNIPVYAMPKMSAFLSKNGPWSQLVDLQNIKIIEQKADSAIHFFNAISITPFLVPHREEFSETVGYKINVNDKQVLFIPDIDKWQKWDRDIVKEVGQSTYAFLDATFYDENELPGRNMNDIPHPFVPETMSLFARSSADVKTKVIFIHFNHTNPLIHTSIEYQKVIDEGFGVGIEGIIYSLDKE